jgi:pyridoxal phosphate-dependent aminotransferase EpsN
MSRIYLSPPHLSGLEKEFLHEALDSNWIAPLGPQVDSFEQEISQYLGVKSAVALSSGTAALHLALRISGVKSGDIVLCPSLTFSSSANVILYESAIPVFIDSDTKTWNLDVFSLEKAIASSKKQNISPKALIVVDLYGQSADYDIITNICKKNNIVVIEDAAEALGSEYNGAKCGSFGKAGIFSFNGNKIITTSGGGMLVSNDEKFVEQARFLSTQAREPKIHYEHKELGYNYRMSNLLAAVGRGQLAVLDERVRSKREIFSTYKSALEHIEGFKFMPEASYGISNRWLTTLTINEDAAGFNRDEVIKKLEKENIESRPVWKPMHLQPLYKDFEYFVSEKGDISQMLFNNGLCLPSGTSLSINDQEKIIDIILSINQ